MYQHQPSRCSCRELSGRIDLSSPSYSGTQPQNAISVAEVQLADSGENRLCSIDAVHELPMMAENNDKIALWLRRQPDAPGGSMPIRRHRWPYYGSEKDLATHYRNLFQDVYTPYLSKAADTRQNFDWFEVRVQCSSPAHNTPITTDLCLTGDPRPRMRLRGRAWIYLFAFSRS